jgi:hypothetical protein
MPKPIRSVIHCPLKGLFLFPLQQRYAFARLHPFASCSKEVERKSLPMCEPDHISFGVTGGSCRLADANTAPRDDGRTTYAARDEFRRDTC